MNLMSDTFWAMEPAAMRRIGHMVQQLPESAWSPEAISDGLQTRKQGNVAIVPIQGPMVKSPGFIESILGFTSTQDIQAAIEDAVSDESVSQILLQVDSPGGSVAGLAELADAVFSAREQKPVIAQVDGQAASAAYQIASQASQIFMGREDMLGSIGVRLMLYDFSKAFENEGVEAVPIDTGEFKSAGAIGTEITEGQREDFQRIVDRFFSGFVDAIMRGRDMSEAQVNEVADGRIFIGQEAVSLGLADGVQTMRETVSQLTAQNRGRSGIARAKVRLAAE